VLEVISSGPRCTPRWNARLAGLPSGEGGAGRAETSWSFGGASPIETAAGTLYPGGLVAGAGHAFLDASLTPTRQTQERLAEGPPPVSISARAARGEAVRDLSGAIIAAVVVTDDQRTTYVLHVEDLEHDPDLGQERGPVALRLGVDPVPARERGWLELRGHDGSAACLVPSAHAYTRVSRLLPASDGAETWVLSQQALGLIGLQLTGAGQDEVERQCSAALARAASRHLDLFVSLPQVDDTVVRVDSLISEPGTWRVYLRAEPGWRSYSAGRNRKWPVPSVSAEDDLGGMYLSQFDGSRGRGDHEELTLRFLPRLNPLARALTLTFSRGTDQVTLELQLP
jgi:hypothetical protein